MSPIKDWTPTIKDKIYTMILKCKLCNFELKIEGTEKSIVTLYKNVTDNHSVFQPDCNAKCIDFEITFVDEKYDKVEKLIIVKYGETEELINEILSKSNEIPNSNTIKSKIINYIENPYPFDGIVIDGNFDNKLQIIINTLDNIINSKDKYTNRFDIIILNYRDLISSFIGESEKKIKFIFDIIKNRNKKYIKETILIIQDIDKFVPDRNTCTFLERISSLTDEFKKCHNEHKIFIIGTSNNIYKISTTFRTLEIIEYSM